MENISAVLPAVRTARHPELRNEALKSLCSSVHRFRAATINEERERDLPHALQALSKA
jgi:hypothetical protein